MTQSEQDVIGFIRTQNRNVQARVLTFDMGNPMSRPAVREMPATYLSDVMHLKPGLVEIVLFETDR